MPDKEELMRILWEQYGISSSEELEDAIRKQGRMDISAFVSREHERKLESDRRNG